MCENMLSLQSESFSLTQTVLELKLPSFDTVLVNSGLVLDVKTEGEL